MSNLQIFKNNEFGEIRTIVKDNDPYLMLVDVCRVLDLNNPSQVKSRLNKDGVISNEVIDSLGRRQIATFINEPNFYKVVFQSRKPQAERFTDWVASEVLPSIRKTGMYMTNEIDSKFLYMLAEQLEQKEKQIAEQQREIEHKKEVIKGVTDDIDIYTKRNVLNKVVRYKGANFAERWNELYERYREVYSIDLKARCQGYNLKQKYKKDRLSTIRYAEKFGHIDNLYKIALKLYETDINEILRHLKKIA